MLLHMLHHPVDIAEIAHVPQLVHLVVADRLDLELAGDVLQVVGRRRKRCDSASRECDLGSRGKFVHKVRIPGSLACHKDLQHIVLPVII